MGRTEHNMRKTDHPEERFVPFCSIYSTSAHRVLLIDSVWARGRVLTTSSQNLE